MPSSESPPKPSRHIPRLRYRPFEIRDLNECMQLLPAWLGFDESLRAALPGLLTKLVDEPAFVSGVIEDTALPAGRKVQGWGSTLILPSEYVHTIRLDSGPEPYITRRIYRDLLSGAFQAPADREIGMLNARGELTAFILHYVMRAVDLTDPYVHTVIASAAESFRMFHGGYNMRAIYYGFNAASEAIAVTNGFRTKPMADAESVSPLAPELRPALYGLTREEARTLLPGTAARHCFEGHPPLFRFSQSQRRLLWLALFDESDEALMPALGVSIHGLKKLWRGIYERIADASPDFFGESAVEDDGKRGPEKRRQVLAYVRQRQEELRAWVE